MSANIRISCAELLYHFQVHIPPMLRESTTYCLKYSKHAQNAVQQDRYCRKTGFKLPAVLNTEKALLIEVGLDPASRRVTKRVYRTRANSKLDLVLVVQPDGTVRTVWFNERCDRHHTLDRARYASA